MDRGVGEVQAILRARRDTQHRVAERLHRAQFKGIHQTGPDLSNEDLADAKWPLARSPYLLETSLPGVFAVGDVRGGNVKRVALSRRRRVDRDLFRPPGAA